MDEKILEKVTGGVEENTPKETTGGPLPGHLCGDGRTGTLIYVKYSNWRSRDIYRCRTCGTEGYIVLAADSNWCDLFPEV